ncbi:hypothetical protein [Bdellovibrio sp. HCB337]|uniref:hypothetical protein n=1 Tax=Bdellovibrio sp. HCB337 TaxID=3394358 RepID=UPI0039A412C6
MNKIISVFGLMGLFLITGCASSSYKARLDTREKQASAAGLYCEWINGDKFSDIDVEVNLQMAKRCDSTKPFTLTPYKNSSDANGIMYCCAMTGGDSSKVASSKRKSTGPAVTAPATSGGGSAPAATAASGGGSAAAPASNAGPASDDDIVEDK